MSSSRLILVSGASGQLGRHVVSNLLSQGTDPKSIIALVRSAEKGRQFEEKGVQVRIGDYGNPESLKAALKGVTHALLISSNNVGDRKAEHETFIDVFNAEKSAQFLAYTSLSGIDDYSMTLREIHKDTEVYIEKSGLPYSFLRNGWYLENNIAHFHSWAQYGVIFGATGQGVISAASCDDFGAAAAKVLTSSNPKKIYELGGNPGYTLDSLAKSATEVIGKPIQAVHLSEKEMAEKFKSFGLPDIVAEVLGNAEYEASKGALEVNSGDLQALIGRDTESAETVMRRTLATSSA